MSGKTVEERLTQAEKDIQQLTFVYKELLTWKRNQATRSLPIDPDPAHPQEGFEKHCFCNRGIRTTPNGKEYCPKHGYDFKEESS